MYTLVKTCIDNNGKPFKKVLTGKDRMSAEFTRVQDAVNILTWKTVKGVRQFVEARSTFKAGHEVNGAVLTIENWDARTGKLHAFARI